MVENKKIVGFKKFTDIKGKPKVEEIDPSLRADPKTDSDIPMNPNLPLDSKKKERVASREKLIPMNQDILSSESDPKEENEGKNEGKVETIGKVARFGKDIKGVKASKAFNFLEAVKISKKSIWYIMVERDNELQMVKYNYKEGVDLNKFVNDLKSYYVGKYKDNVKICEAMNQIKVDGNDKYSIIRGISLIEVDGKKLITKITEDLIRLLSK